MFLYNKRQEITPSKLTQNFSFFSSFQMSCSFLIFIRLEVNKPMFQHVSMVPQLESFQKMLIL